MRVIRAVSGAGGFNLGMNQGHIAGAGIAAHLHQHVVPRWPGDQNFMPIIGRTKTLPELLSDTRALLAEAWESPRRRLTGSGSNVASSASSACWSGPTNSGASEPRRAPRTSRRSSPLPAAGGC